MHDHWLCARMNVNLCGLAKFILHSSGFEVIQPTVQGLARSGDGKRSYPKEMLLFPGFAFINPRGHNHDMLHRINGIQHIFPVIIPDYIIEAFMSDPSAAIVALIPPGAVVRIKNGFFSGRTGICSISTERRVTILLKFLSGGDLPVLLSRKDVELVTDGG